MESASDLSIIFSNVSLIVYDLMYVKHLRIFNLHQSTSLYTSYSIASFPGTNGLKHSGVSG